MTNRSCALIILALTAGLASAKSLDLKKLPAPVQKTIQDEAKGAEIKNISKETEKGVTQYEVETMLNGKHRDFNVDATGAVILVEEESTLDAFPAAAKAAILKKVGGAKIVEAELYKKGGETMYEVNYQPKSGKKKAVIVKADGTETKG